MEVIEVSRALRTPMKYVEADPKITAMVCAAITDSTPHGISAAVNRLVRGGRLVTGDRLPTVRALAAQLGISSATVSEAWQALSSLGVVESRGRAGTFVRNTSQPSRPVRYLGIGVKSGSAALDLSTSMPDPNLLPVLHRALEALKGSALTWTSSYLDNPVLPQLEELLREDWPFEAQRMVTVDGALDGLSRVMDQLVHLGDRVAIENPSFPALIDLLEARGAEILAVDVDDFGVVPESLMDALAREPVALFIHPRAQNPTGASLTPQRITDLVALLQGRRTWIVEADHSGAISSSPDLSLGNFLPEQTIRIRSHSKSHGPDLRIAAMGGPAEILDPLMSRRMLGPGWTSRILQSLLVELLIDEEAVAAVSHARSVYRRRSQEIRKRLMEQGVQCSPGDGINIWVEVEEERSALLTLAVAGINVAPGAPFVSEPLPGHHIRITAGLLPDEPDELDAIAHSVVVAARSQPSARGGIS